MWWKKKRQERYEAAYLDGYNAAKSELEPQLGQAIEIGAIAAYREVLKGLKSVKTPEDLTEVCKEVARNAQLSS